MENQQVISNNEMQQQLVVTDEMKNYLLSVSKWAKFLAILGFIGIGFMLIATFVLILSGSVIAYRENNFFLFLSSIIYLIVAVVYFFPVYFLLKSSLSIQKGIEKTNNEELAQGFKHLKAHYKYIGIMVIVLIALYIIIFLGIMLFAALGILSNGFQY